MCTLHANCLLLHFMLSYYQVMFWPASLYFEQIYFVEISRENFPGGLVWRSQIEARKREGLV